MNLIQTTPPTGTPAISSLEIAQITGKEHAHVMRDIRVTLEEAGIGESKFGSTYTDSQNKQRPCYLLPRRECDLVVSGYSVKYRLAIIDRWHQLEQQAALAAFDIPQTYSAALRLCADQQDQLVEKDKQLAIAAPKVAFHDAVTESDDVCQLAVAAQVAKLPFGRNTLFQRLRQMGVLISGTDRHNLPKQEFINRGLFTVNERKFQRPDTGEPMITFTTYATQKGIAWIVQQFGGASV